MDAFAKIREVAELGVIGIGIGGLEDGFPPGLFTPVYDAAREAGFHLTAHAGEAAGAGPIATASSASRTWRASTSASL